MCRVPKDKIVVVKHMERHHNLSMCAQLHSTMEFAMELVEGKRSALHNALTVGGARCVSVCFVSAMMRALMRRIEHTESADLRHWVCTDIRQGDLRLRVVVHHNLLDFRSRHPLCNTIRLALAEGDLPTCQDASHGSYEELSVPPGEEGDVGDRGPVLVVRKLVIEVAFRAKLNGPPGFWVGRVPIRVEARRMDCTRLQVLRSEALEVGEGRGGDGEALFDDVSSDCVVPDPAQLADRVESF